MSDHEFDHLLLPAAALLRRLDGEVLCEVAGCPTHQAEALLAGNLVEPVGDTCRLRAELVTTTLARLRSEQPSAEIALHTAAFHYYLNKLQADAAPSRVAVEDECCYHLDQLFLLIGGQHDWQTILEYTLALRAASPEQRRHRQRVQAYEGYIATRTDDFLRGEALLSDLLAQTIEEPATRIKALKGLADSAYTRSRYDTALELYQQIYEVALATGDLAYQGLALLNQGLVHHELERYDEALRYCTESLPYFEAPGEERRLAAALYHAGLYSMYLGRWDDAWTFNARTEQLFKQLGLDSQLGFIYWQQGYLNHIFGNEAASEEAYLRALPLAESPQHGQPSLAKDVWLYLGLLAHTQEQWSTALQHYDRALALATQQDRQHQTCMIHYRRGQSYDRQRRDDEALDAYLTAIASIESLRSKTIGEDVRIGLLGTTQQLYESTVLLYLERGQLEEAFHYAERARSRAFLDSLEHKSPHLALTLDQPVTTVHELQQHLPESALIVEYFTAGVLPRHQHLINSIPAGNTRLRSAVTLVPQVVVFTISRDHFGVHRLKLNPNTLRPQLGDTHPGRHLLNGRIPHHLYDTLIAPIEGLIDRSATVYIIPHGPLHYVPFTALSSADGKYLIRRHGPAVAQAPSATVLLRHCLNRAPSQAATTLCIGYNDPGGDRPLHFAEAEASYVARLMDGTAWTDAEPKRERLFQSGKQAGLIHIAGHAYYTPHDPLGSALLLGAGDLLSARDIIDGLDLDAATVTLSSCTSGVTGVVPGDELLGLQRALLYAGATSIVCTRWEAVDLVAPLVMDRFYAGLRQGASPAVALRDAQVEVRELAAYDLMALFEQWRAANNELAGAIGDPATILASLQAENHLGQPQPLFAHALLWAPYIVVGRA